MRICERDYLLTKDSLTLDSMNRKTQVSSRFWGKCIQMASVLAIGVALSTGAFAAASITGANYDHTGTAIGYRVNPVAASLTLPTPTSANLAATTVNYYYGTSGADLTGTTDNQGLVTFGATATVTSNAIAGPASCTYTPAVGFHGMDTFTYYIHDATDSLDTVAYTVTLLVGDPLHVETPNQDVPFVVTPVANTLTNFVATGGVSTYTCTIRSLPLHGTLTQNAGGAITAGDTTTGLPKYTPNDTFYGHDSFNYTITDSATPAAMISGEFDIYVELPGFAAAEKETLNVAAIISGTEVLGIDGGGTVNLTNPRTASLNTNSGGVYVHNSTLRLDTTAQQISTSAYRLRGFVTGGNRVTVDGTVSLT